MRLDNLFEELGILYIDHPRQKVTTPPHQYTLETWLDLFIWPGPGRCVDTPGKCAYFRDAISQTYLFCDFHWQKLMEALCKQT